MGGMSPVDTIEMSASPSRPDVGRALASALGDPTLRVWFRQADERPSLEPAGAGRGLVEVVLAGEVVGVISYDAARVTDRGRVVAVAQLVALEADHARLAAELATARSSVREPMARLVECNETERRRIARDLHDGLQNRLVLMGLGAQLIERDPTASDSVLEGVAQLRAELSASVAELRRLAAGVMPVTLVERGLFTAAEHSVSSLPIRASLTLSGTSDDLPSAVESAAYFVVTEATTNVLKHSQADSVSIALERNLATARRRLGQRRRRSCPTRRRRTDRSRRPAQRPRGPPRDRQPTGQGDAGVGRDPVRTARSGTATPTGSPRRLRLNPDPPAPARRAPFSG